MATAETVIGTSWITSKPNKSVLEMKNNNNNPTKQLNDVSVKNVKEALFNQKDNSFSTSSNELINNYTIVPKFFSDVQSSYITSETNNIQSQERDKSICYEYCFVDGDDDNNINNEIKNVEKNKKKEEEINSLYAELPNSTVEEQKEVDNVEHFAYSGAQNINNDNDNEEEEEEIKSNEVDDDKQRNYSSLYDEVSDKTTDKEQNEYNNNNNYSEVSNDITETDEENNDDNNKVKYTSNVNKVSSKNSDDMPVLVPTNKNNNINNEKNTLSFSSTLGATFEPVTTIKINNHHRNDDSDESSSSSSDDDSDSDDGNDDDEISTFLEKASAETLKRVVIHHSQEKSANLLNAVVDSLRKEIKKEKNKQKKQEKINKNKNLHLIEGKSRQWNEEYQSIMSNTIVQFTSREVKQLVELTHDFVSVAEAYAKIIINELGVANEQKSIKPASVGGVAGGAKYIVNGILFKFCLDVQVSTTPKPLYMYGGSQPRDDLAIKAGGLEMQGLEGWASQTIPGLCFPLMALIDFKGFRLVATSLLPIQSDSNKKKKLWKKSSSTLHYGSADGGRTVLNSDSMLAKMVETAAKKMNLKGHMVGGSGPGRKGAFIHGPGDIEGHKGKDGRYYLLDFARTMPPEAPQYEYY